MKSIRLSHRLNGCRERTIPEALAGNRARFFRGCEVEEFKREQRCVNGRLKERCWRERGIHPARPTAICEIRGMNSALRPRWRLRIESSWGERSGKV
jgi:hypothetical protein